ncbi:hypothetical protein niasHT_017969 [Heterodera trifolii]|uniref:Reverse transcriptase domain-containing protein n=1 Tax=Heterodera trifolii TaxID=157864 RepID=A0ABD2LCH4_9BILA
MERLPFGVKSAPGIFQSIMDKMLAGLNFATAYLDDIIVASQTFNEHTDHLKEVFDRLQSFGFRVKISKCAFFQEEIKYLGLIIDKNGRRPDNKSSIFGAKFPVELPFHLQINFKWLVWWWPKEINCCPWPSTEQQFSGALQLRK